MAFALLVNIAGFVLPMAGTARAGLSLRPATVPAAPTVSTGLSVRLATVPAATTVSMVVRRDSEYERVAEMPAQLTQWGCDEEMWTNLRASARKSLRRLATRGDQKGNAREVIRNLRAALERDAGTPSVPTGGQTKPAVKAEAKATAAAAAEAAEVMKQAEATVAKVNKEAAAKALVDAKKAAEEKKAAEAEAAEAKALVERVKEEVEEKADEKAEEKADPLTDVEPEAPSAQPEVEIEVFNTAWPEVEAVGALAPNGFSWGPTF